MLNEAIEQLPNARVISLADQNGQTLIQKLVLPTLLGGIHPKSQNLSAIILSTYFARRHYR